ncbi:MAG: hypothetical protein GWP15_02655 [Nitrospirae bacterium]|nr:hypothetical protein [Nitrospirota bacterium]
MLESVKQIAKYPLRIPSAFAEAVKKARADQDAGFFEKLGIFFSAFTDAMGGIERDRNAVSKGTQAAVQSSITQTMKSPRTRLNLKKVPKNLSEKELVDKTLAVVTRGFGQLDRTTQGHAQKALKKLESRLQGKPENLNYNEVTCLGATATAVLLELKQKFPNRSDFKKALDNYLKASEGSNFPLRKMMKFSTLSIFKLKFLDNSKLGRALGLGVTNIPGLLSLTGLKESPIKNETKIIAFFKNHILKNTSSSNIARLVKRINRIFIRGGDSMTTEDITEITFLIDNGDFKHLISALTKNRS